MRQEISTRRKYNWGRRNGKTEWEKERFNELHVKHKRKVQTMIKKAKESMKLK